MEDIYYKGYKIRIREDENADSPDEWEDDNLFLVYNHRQFNITRRGFSPINIYENGAIYEKEYWIFLVEAYIHSGISLSLFVDKKQRNWDSSLSGYILASKNEFKDLKIAYDAAEGLIETWNQYLSGEVYGYIIEKPTTYYRITEKNLKDLNDAGNIEYETIIEFSDIEDEWEEVDSCWGFYGQDAAIDEAEMVIDYLTKE